MDAQVLIQWLKREVSPALGCTEPVAIAFAAAVAAQHLGEPVVGITGTVSENLYKNAMGVTIPGTGSSGVALAAAIGSIAGDPNAGLEVFRNVMLQHVAQANLMVSDGQITIEQKATHEFLHVDLTLKGENRQCRVIVNGGHTNVTYLAVDDHVRIDRPARSTGRADDALPAFTLRDAFEFAGSVDFDDIAFILEAAKMNSALSAEGRRVRYGLNVGGTLRDAISQGLMQNDLLNRIVIDATSASDARMGGATLPAMTNFGSGNQGITATMPVVTVAEHLQADDETLARALALSHLVAISIHARYTRLSALCAVTTAAMGAAAPGNHILALRIEQEVHPEGFFAAGRVAREAHARAGKAAGGVAALVKAAESPPSVAVASIAFPAASPAAITFTRISTFCAPAPAPTEIQPPIGRVNAPTKGPIQA